ncbi:TPA: hypothetical protein ACGY8I_004427 [Aeromonas hydrophila]|uniref:hypothetical protein n=1 Tax=Aeromonas TaxID=642 RepID=UPI001FF5662D|nr:MULTISPECIES: hypothetical protein [Aeromonas]MCK0188222.1 hypothetical protein [Aeromonas hydrophila]UOV94444.1 hypothetical protein MUW98_23545 [Aeromonas hydrophila]
MKIHSLDKIEYVSELLRLASVAINEILVIELTHEDKKSRVIDNLLKRHLCTIEADVLSAYEKTGIISSCLNEIRGE